MKYPSAVSDSIREPKASLQEIVMTTTTLTPTDQWMLQAIGREFQWDPRFDASSIAVTAHDGAVVLSGFIDTYAGKLAAERAAKRVRGVRTVANDIDVRLRVARTDEDIAVDLARGLKLHNRIPDTVQGAVHHGDVTLTGQVMWSFQSRDAERVARHIAGVRALHNRIVVAPRPIAKDVRHRIVEALHHNANVDARHIALDVTGDVAKLTGYVGTWLQRDTAEHAAANAPGIRTVVNDICVLPPVVDTTSVVDEIC
jgi:osmotically-inducible protein OsmY